METASQSQPSDIGDFEKRLKSDFKAFLWVIWKHLNLPEPTPVQYDIANFLQHGPRRQTILAFRGVGKSWITSAYVCWLLYCDPQIKVLVVSASKERADNFSTFTLQLIDSVPILKHLYPSYNQRQSKISFDVGPAMPDHAPSVKSVGITGQMSGSRAHVLVADDVEVPSNSETQLKREKLSEAVKEFDAILKPNGRIKFLGTPQTEDSLYNKLETRGYVTRIWPARIPDTKGMEKYSAKLAPFITKHFGVRSGELTDLETQTGSPVDPLRFGEDDLTERELSYGRSGFALQFQLDTTLSDQEKFPLKLSDLIVTSLNPHKGPREIIWAADKENIINDLPNVGLDGDKFYGPAWKSDEWEDYGLSTMFIDPSGRGQDETAYAIVHLLHGRIFVTEVNGLNGTYDEAMCKHILKVAKEHGVNEILVEPNFGDGMFAHILGSCRPNNYNVSIEDAPWARQQKEARIIDTLEPVLNQHRLIIDRGVLERDYRDTEKRYRPELRNAYRLAYQLTHITRDRGCLLHYDRLDALAGAVARCIEYMGVNSGLSVEQSREEDIRRELESFMNGVLNTNKSAKKSPFSKHLRAFKGW
jgi:hypothetical protein